MLNSDLILEGERVYLRSITDSLEDTAHIIEWRNSETVRPFFIYQKPFTVQSHEEWLKREIFSGRGFQFIVCRKEDHKPIGCTYLRDYDPHTRKAEYGVFLGETKERGKGIGKEILNLTTEFGFQKVKLHKIFARAFADNTPSVQCFLKCGFTKEAYLRDEEYVNGQYRDIVLLGKINPLEMENTGSKEFLMKGCIE